MSLPAIHDLGDMAPPVTVVADLHLRAERPDVLEAFRTCLEGVEARGGTLVLLGDVFDHWLGRRQADERFERGVLDALRGLAATGVRLAFVEGNRDFLFDGADGLALERWPDVVKARWGERAVVLSHGDLLCTADHAYLGMRRAMRRLRPLEPLVPYGLRRWIAARLRRKSSSARKTTEAYRMALDYGEARRWLEGYDADALVVGHVHTGVHHRLEVARPRDVYVLKDWEVRPNAVVFDEDGIRLGPI